MKRWGRARQTIGMLAAGGVLAAGGLATSGVPVAQASTAVVPSGHVVISVRVGGDRLPGANVTATGVAGATLRLSSSETNANAWSSYKWATCTTDSDGDCNFVVPVKSGSSSSSATAMGTGAKPWVHQVSVPAGYRLLNTVRTGSGNGSSSKAFNQRFRLDTTVSAGKTYRSLDHASFMRKGLTSQSTLTASAGTWTVARTNPEVTQR